MNNKDQIYLPGLNGIRAIAAMIVVIWHIDVFSKVCFDLERIGFGFNGMASHAVTIFFVLSGFLITYLLLLEKEKSKSINLKNFYLRRILRIWPLYFLILLLSILITIILSVKPSSNWLSSIFMYTFFLPNLAYAMDLKIIPAAPLWSIGVEEQFYIIWPFLFFNSRKKIFRNLIVFLIIFIGIKIFVTHHGSPLLRSFIEVTRLHCMAIGGIGAYLYLYHKKLTSIVLNRPVEIVSWLLLCYSIFYRPFRKGLFYEVEINALIYLVIIMNVNLNSKNLLKLEHPILNFLGRISYGIYVYHLPIIFIFYKLLKEPITYFNNQWISYSIVTGLTLVTTIITAKLSYEYLESPILKFKRKFSTINSTNRSSFKKA